MEQIKRIAILDPSICTSNIGDKIIMDSAEKEIKSVFKNAFYVKIPTQEIIFKMSYKHIKNSEEKIVCGTNLLSSNMPFYNQWKIGLFDSLFLKDVVLLGVGWWQYQRDPNIYTRRLLKRVLSNKKIHSVRDNYTKNMLEKIGIKNVINTSCPTMWMLNKQHCEKVPVTKSENVIFTVTDYNKDIVNDKFLIHTLIENYSKVFFWVQSYNDIGYIFNELNFSKKDVIIVSPTIEKLDEVLINESVDYVGTRLHAGIRALQHQVRTIIIGIDNRALEKAKDFNVCVIERDSIAKNLYNLIYSDIKCNISIPEDNIEIWKNQFLNQK